METEVVENARRRRFSYNARYQKKQTADWRAAGGRCQRRLPVPLRRLGRCVNVDRGDGGISCTLWEDDILFWFFDEEHEDRLVLAVAGTRAAWVMHGQKKMMARSATNPLAIARRSAVELFLTIELPTVRWMFGKRIQQRVEAVGFNRGNLIDRLKLLKMIFKCRILVHVSYFS